MPKEHARGFRVHGLEKAQSQTCLTTSGADFSNLPSAARAAPGFVSSVSNRYGVKTSVFYRFLQQ